MLTSYMREVCVKFNYIAWLLKLLQIITIRSCEVRLNNYCKA